ncbi:MAG: hypothetical protein JWN14_240 [Chthonomonadales bacterium]|nr:hypothetical protein [Chthonomonadales bacterium]
MSSIDTTPKTGQLRKEEIRDAFSATWQVDWTQFALVPAMRCVPGIAASLLLGLQFHNAGAGVMASAGALTVGFGSFYRFQWSRSAPMLLAILGISFSAFISALSEHSTLGFTIVACCWAYFCGLLQTLGKGIWWVSLQCVIFALIASSFPVGFADTATRTLMVFGGGLLQALLIMLFWRLERPLPPTFIGPLDIIPFSVGAVRDSVRAFWSHLRANLSPKTPVGRTALQLAVAVALGAALSRLLNLPNGYWVPMTAILVMNTDWRQTVTNGLGRICGTLVGAGLATPLAATLRPDPSTLIMLVVLFSFLCFLFLRVNYAVYAIFVTAFVVFQLASVGLPTTALVPARILNTALGGALALLLHFVWPVSIQERRETTSEGAVSV